MQPLVVIDARMIGPTGHGIAEYVRDLVLGLSELQSPSYKVHLLVSNRMLSEDPLRKIPHTEVGAPFLSATEMIEVPRVLKKLRADLFHSPSFAAFPLLKIPTVYTVHDLIHLHFGSWAHKAYYQFLLRPALERAVKVCTVSEFSRKEIAGWMGWPADRIALVRNAIHVESPQKGWEERLKKWGLIQYQYHFSLSSYKPHKNMPFLIKAYLAHAEKHEAAWPLVISLTEAEVGFRHPKIVCVGSLSQDDKNTLLAGAGAFYFPSLREGFGRPPLEAYLLNRTKIAVSDIPVHLELMSQLEPTPRFLSPYHLNQWTEQFLHFESMDSAGTASSGGEKKLDGFGRRELAQQMGVVYQSHLDRNA